MLEYGWHSATYRPVIGTIGTRVEFSGNFLTPDLFKGSISGGSVVVSYRSRVNNKDWGEADSSTDKREGKNRADCKAKSWWRNIRMLLFFTLDPCALGGGGTQTTAQPPTLTQTLILFHFCEVELGGLLVDVIFIIIIIIVIIVSRHPCLLFLWIQSAGHITHTGWTLEMERQGREASAPQENNNVTHLSLGLSWCFWQTEFWLWCNHFPFPFRQD